jgi:sugar (pentulose or hexulose) kinase
MRFIAVDLGASFIKSAIFDIGTASISHVTRTPSPPFLSGLPETHREVDATLITREVEAHVTRLIEQTRDCAGIVMCSQMHGFVLVDRRGQVASNYISWQDQRGISIYDRLRDSISADLLFRLGNEIGPAHPFVILTALLETRAIDLAAGLTPVPLPNFVVTQLCGGEPTADATQAASFGTFDITTGTWSAELIGRPGFNLLGWPRITECSEEVGRYRGIPVYSPVGDQQAAVLGSLLTDGELSVNIGTGSQVSTLVDSITSGDYKVRPFFDRFLNTITHLPAGRALKRLALFLQAEDESDESLWRRIDASVATTASTDLVVDLSFFPTAFGNHGKVENIHEQNLTPGHLFLAAYESMARNYAIAGRRLGGNWQRAVLSGGVVRKASRLREKVAEHLGLESRLSPCEEETLLGLGVLATAIAEGHSRVSEAAAQVRARL